jgi:hypothetical protein
MNTDSSFVRTRRSRRIAREIPIEISGLDLWGRDFTTSTRTLVLSRYGAKIYLEQDMAPEQEITVSRPGIGKTHDARVVALFTKEPPGHTYGIEFLNQYDDVWGIRFLAALEPADPAVEATAALGRGDATAETEQEPLPTANPVPVLAAPDRLQRSAGTKNYRLRFKCQYDDEDQWVVLTGRMESLEEMLGAPWDYECPTHGSQRSFPLAAMEDRELAGGAGMRPGGQPERRLQGEVRIAKILLVRVRGVDRSGRPFSQSAYTVNISRHGARLDGTGFLTRPGETVEIKRGWRKATFRVVWCGPTGMPHANHIGLRSLQPEKNIWRIS